MLIVKRIVGIAFTLLAVAFLAIGNRGNAQDGTAQSILDSPESSGRLLGTLIPVVLFGVVGVWLLFSKNPSK